MLTLIGVRSIPVLLQWHVKDPGHSAKSAGSRLHLNTHTSWTQRSRSVLTMLSMYRLLEAITETSPHANRQGTLGHNHLSSLSQCGVTYPKEWNRCLQADPHLIKKKGWGWGGVQERNESSIPPPPIKAATNTKYSNIKQSTCTGVMM